MNVMPIRLGHKGDGKPTTKLPPTGSPTTSASQSVTESTSSTGKTTEQTSSGHPGVSPSTVEQVREATTTTTDVPLSSTSLLGHTSTATLVGVTLAILIISVGLTYVAFFLWRRRADPGRRRSLLSNVTYRNGAEKTTDRVPLQNESYTWSSLFLPWLGFFGSQWDVSLWSFISIRQIFQLRTVRTYVHTYIRTYHTWNAVLGIKFQVCKNCVP